jgi:hypothetical protein
VTLPSDGLIPFSRITQKVVQARLAVDTLINGPSMILHAPLIGQRCCRNSCILGASPDKQSCPAS